MKKIYSLVLMAMMLLIGTNVWADEPVVIDTVALIKHSLKYPAMRDSAYTSLEGAWADVRDGETITLLATCTPTKTLWLGTTTMADSTNVKSITLDMAGFNINFNFSQSTKPAFFITHGSLDVIGEGTLTVGNVADVANGGHTPSSAWLMFQVAGSTYKMVDPSDDTKTPYTHLTIGPNVTIDAQGIGIVVDRLKETSSTSQQWPLSSTGKYAAVATSGVNIPAAPFNTNLYQNGNRGTAYGVRVDMKGHIIAGKYGIKANTELAGPSNTPISDVSGYVVNFDENGDAISYSDDTKAFEKTYAPFIKIHNGATVTEVNKTEGGVAAVYSGGYARWQIEGTCKGSTGAFIKSGEVVLAGNARVESNYEGSYTIAGDGDLDRGFEGGGSGMVINSSKLGVGDTEVTISGSATVAGASGYAIEEGLSSNQAETKVTSINITGGTIQQSATGQGIITVTSTTADPNNNTTIAITGGTIEGQPTGVTIGAQTLNEFLQTQREQGHDTHGVIITEDPVTHEQTVVISPGPAPIVANNVVADTIQPETVRINWINSGDTRDTLVANLKFAELQISQDYPQIVVIPDGKTLEVGRVVLGVNAQIVVKAGGKFIVSDTTGIAAFTESNLILENEPGKRSIFLFHPDVTSNIHPMATYQLTTNSWYVDENSYQWERFGVPTHNALTSIKNEKVGEEDVYSEIQRYDDGTWTSLGYIGGNYNTPGYSSGSFHAVDPAELNKPFATYNLLAYRTTSETAPVCVMSGELVGNVDASLYVNKKWVPFANSYTADINVETMLSAIHAENANISADIYIAKPQGNNEYAWEAVDADEAEGEKLAPMQAFILHNVGSAEYAALNYGTMVYKNYFPSYNPSSAPRRAIAEDNTAKLRVILTNENGLGDNVKLRENATNTKALEKYMNDDVNIYAMNAEKAAIYAVEDLDNTFIGVSTVRGGNFTISFAKVEGREFDLIDLETGVRFAASEGETYQFHMDANTVADYRFKLVDRQNAPTAIENTDAVKNVKGIYTITGQYVGEMNVWNTLPAGVYVIDGAKCVK